MGPQRISSRSTRVRAALRAGGLLRCPARGVEMLRRALLSLVLASFFASASSLVRSNPGAGRHRSRTRRAAAAGLLSALSSPQISAAVPDSTLSLPPSIYRDAAGENERGSRPVIFGVPGGVVYFTLAAGLQASILLSGKSGTMLNNGTVFRDGKPVAQPFKYTSDDAAKAARDAQLGGQNSTRTRGLL